MNREIKDTLIGLIVLIVFVGIIIATSTREDPYCVNLIKKAPKYSDSLTIRLSVRCRNHLGDH